MSKTIVNIPAVGGPEPDSDPILVSVPEPTTIVVPEPTPAPFVSEPEAEPVVQDHMIALMEILLANKLDKENIPSIVLTNDQIEIIKELVSNSPGSLKNINQTFLSILSDGKIDVIDIPQFIRIIKDVYVICHQSNQITLEPMALAINMVPVVKYIIRAIISCTTIENPTLVISYCDNIINISVEMIQLQSSLKNEKWSWTCKLC